MTDVCFLSLTRILCFAMSEGQIVVIGYLSKKQRNTTGNVTIRKIIISQRMIRVQHGSSDTHTHTVLHNPKHRINRWCFHYVTFVFGVQHWASVLFLAAGPWWAPECLHYPQETEHERILQGTIKEVRGQPWVNTFRGATRWRHGDPSPQHGKRCLTVKSQRRSSSSSSVCSLCCRVRRDRTSGP